MSIYSPTWLYIKQHTVTGMLYFGKTSRTWSEKYKGSGKYWTSHINKHGREHVVTLWHDLFENQEELTNFALDFSEKMNIVKSDQWLNFRPENGIDGAPSGYKHSPEAISKMKIAANNRSSETHARMSLGQRNKAPASAETRAKISLANENSSAETRADHQLTKKSSCFGWKCWYAI